MRLAVITDIHANLPALEAVLADADAVGVERLWCLGDVLGYGADPDACTELVRERCDLCLVGNHDLAVLGDLDPSSFSEAAAEAVAWTRENAAPSTLEFLRDLEPSAERDGTGLFHASPRDPVWEYVLSTEQAAACMDVQPGRLALIGHSHVALFFARADGGGHGDVTGAQAGDGTELELGDGTWLDQPGQRRTAPRHDLRAAWLELDTEAGMVHFHRVSYDIRRAAASIAEAGLPQRLADRLYVGQ